MLRVKRKLTESFPTREATIPLSHYLCCQNQDLYDPPCSILIDNRAKCLLELGSGQAKASLTLANHLSPEDTLVLTDLPQVVPLCLKRVDRWSSSQSQHPDVHVIALEWGKPCVEVARFGPFTHILLCDLVSMSPSVIVS